IGSDEPTEADNSLLLDLLPTREVNAIAAVVVTATTEDRDEEPNDDPVPTVVAELRADSDRGPLYTTVDNVDRFTGLTAMIVSLRDAETGDRGHYGQAAGAGAVLPGDR